MLDFHFHFILAKKHKAIGIVACFVDNALWDGNEEFSCIIKQLKSTFKIGAEQKEMTSQSYLIRINNQHHQPDPNLPRTVKTTPSPTLQRGNHTVKRSTWKIKSVCMNDSI